MRTLLGAYQQVREATERLAGPLSPEDQTVQTMPDVSPPKWHRAHTTWFFETFRPAPTLAAYVASHPPTSYLLHPFYGPVGSADQLKLLFKDTPKVVACFEQLLGQPYPWDKYAQVIVRNFNWGGMENTSATTLAEYAARGDAQSQDDLISHELAHQWWAHQVIGADMQGDTALSETLAQYSALIVMEKTYGPDGIRKFLKRELDSYLRSRGGEVVAELPLIRVEDPPYIHYRKGSLVMYRLQDEIGEEAVNRALRSLLQQFAFKGAPYPTSLDLVAALRAQAPADKQQLITDLFEKLTLSDVKTKGVQVKKRADGRVGFHDGEHGRTAAAFDEKHASGEEDQQDEKSHKAANHGLHCTSLVKCEVRDGEWRYRLTVRTDGSQPLNRGSIPRTATIT